MHVSTYTRKLITERLRILAHFTLGDQFIGFSGSSVCDSSHHTLSSGGEAGVGLRKKCSGLGESIICNYTPIKITLFSEQKSFYTTIKRENI
jgi:hypothetical protein